MAFLPFFLYFEDIFFFFFIAQFRKYTVLPLSQYLGGGLTIIVGGIHQDKWNYLMS